jgi:hypothetical protein
MLKEGEFVVRRYPFAEQGAIRLDIKRGSASLFEASMCRNLSESSNKADNDVRGGRPPRNTKYFKFFFRVLGSY